jgi:hypothetical protein
MHYIVVALHAEARPFLDHFRFERITPLPYALYTHEEMLLLVMQPGYENALLSVSALLGYRPPQAGDTLVNVGICAGPRNVPIGEVLLAHKLIYKEHAYYPDILYQHHALESDLVTTLLPEDTAGVMPVDMEAHAVFKAASRFFDAHEMGFIKVVSDHFAPECVTKEGTVAMIDAAMPKIRTIMQGLATMAAKPAHFSAEELLQIAAAKVSLTKSQQSRLDDALCYYRLRHNSALPEVLHTLVETTHKQQRKESFEHLIHALTL